MYTGKAVIFMSKENNHRHKEEDIFICWYISDMKCVCDSGVLIDVFVDDDGYTSQRKEDIREHLFMAKQWKPSENSKSEINKSCSSNLLSSFL